MGCGALERFYDVSQSRDDAEEREEPTEHDERDHTAHERTRALEEAVNDRVAWRGRAALNFLEVCLDPGKVLESLMLDCVI